MHFFDFDNNLLKEKLSGERFSVSYNIRGTEAECREIAQEICVEQSIEFPPDQVPQGEILDQIVGRIERFEFITDGLYQAEISYAVETVSGEFTQLLNVIFGNFSIKPSVQVVDIKLSPSLLEMFSGPQFGIAGLREIVNVDDRPLLFTALKPMGLSSSNFGRLIGVFAENGIDIIKDDHGLTNQSFAPFRERVKICGEAIQNANAKTGGSSIYVPNITAPPSQLRERALLAKEHGAGGLLVAPGLVGFDAMRDLADGEINLPIFAHPAFSGSMAVNPQGFTLQMLYGLITRLAGADATIFPGNGGRFTFTKEECIGIAETGKKEMGSIKPIFPCPAGGMNFAKIPQMLADYGKDVMFLIGGGLFSHSRDLVANCRYFSERVQELSGQ